MQPEATFLDQIEPKPPMPTRPRKLYTMTGVIIATLFGAPMAGCVIMAINAFRLGRPRQAWMLLSGGFIATAALITIGFLIPDSWHVPSLSLMVPQVMAMGGIAKSLQKADIDAHKAAGGRFSSSWLAAAIGLATCLVLFVGALAAMVSMSGPTGTEVQVGSVSVYYADEATEADAQMLASELKRIEFLDGDEHPLSLQISKDAKGYTVCFVLNDEALKDPTMSEGFRRIGAQLANGKLGHPLKIWLCDDVWFKKIKVEIR